MTNKSPRAVLWDMDGTLVDTGEQHFQAWRDILASHGIRYDRADHEACFGMRNDAIIRRFFDASLSSAEASRLADDKERRFREMAAAAGLEVLPGVKRWLSKLRDAGYRMAIASSAPVANIEALVLASGIGEFFHGYASGEDVPQGKPAPDLFLHAARLLGVPEHRCVVVEDAAVGVLAAHRAGMRAIGVGPHHATLNADVAAESLLDLPEDVFERLVTST
jgi:beta-phosphoglucomutase